ncbi:unnamed protein product [Lota lota]
MSVNRRHRAGIWRFLTEPTVAISVRASRSLTPSRRGAGQVEHEWLLRRAGQGVERHREQPGRPAGASHISKCRSG